MAAKEASACSKDCKIYAKNMQLALGEQSILCSFKHAKMVAL